MQNLLEETKSALARYGYAETDITFIGAKYTEHQCTWEEFCDLADVEYDSGWGAQKVAMDLIIVFCDGSMLERAEYDGSEWWRYIALFKKPQKALPIKTLFCKPEQIGWVTLEGCNRIEEEVK